jgi:hypothetical protein
MSTIAVSDSFSRLQGCVKQTSSSSKNYLNRYVECDPAKSALSHARKEKLWKIASVAGLVAYTIIVALAAVLTGIFAPAYLPVAIAAAITLTPLAYQFFYVTLQKWSAQHASEAKIEEGVAKKLAKIPTSSDQVASLLMKMADKLPSLAHLRPAIARYQYWEEMSEKWLESGHALGKETVGVNQENAKNPDKIKEIRLESMDLREDSQIAKVRAAFLLHILRNPCLRGDENDNDLFSFKIIPPSERLLRAAFQDPSHDLLVNVKDAEKTTMSIQELMPLKINEVYDRLGKSLKGG